MKNKLDYGIKEGYVLCTPLSRLRNTTGNQLIGEKNAKKGYFSYKGCRENRRDGRQSLEWQCIHGAHEGKYGTLKDGMILR